MIKLVGVRALLLQLLLLLVIQPAHAENALASAVDKPLIEWFVSDSPPLTIIKGPFKNQGYGDAVYQQIAKKLDNYHHQRQIVSVGHAQNAIMHHQNVCAYDLLKTAKRSAYMIFSKPIYPILPIGAISLEQNDVAGMLDEQGYFMLSKLVGKRDFVLGLAANRSYGEVLDKALLAIAKGKGGVSHSANNLATGLLGMIELKRVDASLGYASEAFYLSTVATTKHQIKHPDKVIYYPIKNQPALLMGHIGCNRSELGQAVITAINQQIDAADTAIIVKAYQRWLPDRAKVLHSQLIDKD